MGDFFGGEFEELKICIYSRFDRLSANGFFGFFPNPVTGTGPYTTTLPFLARGRAYSI